MILSAAKIQSICQATLMPPELLGASGAITLGRKRASDLSLARYAYEARIQMYGASNTDCAIAVATGSVTTNTPAVRQVETATVVGSASAVGSVRAAITSAFWTGAINVDVPVTNGMVASEIADLLRAEVIANTQVAAHYTETGSGDSIRLRAILPAANDGALNIAISQPFGTGITPAPTSTNTTNGFNGSDIISPVSSGIDAFGFSLPTMTDLVMAYVTITGGGVVMEVDAQDSLRMPEGTILSLPTGSISSELIFTQYKGSPLIEALIFYN